MGIKRIICFTFIAGLLMLPFAGTNSCNAFELTPEGAKLYKQWTEVIGYSAAELVKKMDPAPEIKPGLVITPENVGNHPGIKALLPETIYNRLDPNFFLPIKQITITETRPRYYTQQVIDGTKECLENVKLNKETLQIENYKYGLPFPQVSDPLHVIWNHNVANLSFEENLWFDPVAVTTYNANRKVDAVWKGNIGRYRVMGRLYTDIGEDRMSEYFKGSGIFEQGSLLLTYPTNMKGVAFLRTRYMNVNKQDYFVAYLPGLKRLRVLSGSDAQDPILGSELCWDSWAVEWQKQPSKKLFPNDYKILGKRIILQPIYPSTPSLKIEGEQYITKWEKRPVWVLEIKAKDPAYVFSKRIMYADMEHFKAIYQEYYDRRGNLMRTWEDFKFQTHDGFSTWEGVDILNWITKRHSCMKMNSHPNPALEPEQFDMRWLTRMAR
jgi:uncharacterized protein DUF1329